MPSTREVVANLFATAIVAALLWLVSHVDAPIQLWVLLLVAVVVALVAYGVGRSKRKEDNLLGHQAEHLGEAILTLREFAGGRTTTSFADFVERGVLAPARYGLSVVPGEQIRLSVIALNSSGEAFEMLYEAGHTVGRKDNFSLSRTTLAGHALDSKQLQWTDNVHEDNRWQAHPLAKDKRQYKSLASAPILVGDEAVAVLNVLSSEEGAFLRGDLTYIEMLAGLIALAWDLNSASDGRSTVVDT
jgi:GAF domain-containing protein